MPSATAKQVHNDVFTEALHMPTVSRFYYLLCLAKALVCSHGPYTTHINTTVFTRATHPTKKPHGPSSRRMAISLATAQDCIGSAQVPGPAEEDLYIFKRLRDTAIEVLENVLTTGDLDHESFGWGIWGLCAGYVYPTSEASYKALEEYKHRLHESLLTLLMTNPRLKRTDIVQGEANFGVLAKARRQMHICAILILQKYRQEGWHRIRWWHVVKIAERWAARLNLADSGELSR